ncbi:MAG: outer membrane beta-barrel protein [Bacteroidota bacterium]
MNHLHKPFFFITLIFLMGISGSAQTNRFALGLEAGPNFTYIRGTDYATKYLQPSIGYSISGIFQYNFNKNFASITRLGFAKKSSKSEGDAVDQSNNIIGKYTVYYNCYAKTAAISIRTYFFSTSRMRYFFDLGIYSDLMNTYNNEIILTINGIAQPNQYDQSHYIISHLGIVGSIGLAYSLTSKIGLTVELQNWFGLINYQTQYSNPITKQDKITTKPNSTGLTMGIYYQFMR